MPVPARTCVAGNSEVRSSGKCPRVSAPSGDHRLGKAGRVNASEPLMMPRYVKPQVMDAGLRHRDFAAEMRQAAAGYEGPVVRAPLSSGFRRHPPRPLLVRVERGNPVGVRHWVVGAGKPTAREAQLPSGERMTKKRTPAAERQQEHETRWPAPPPAAS